ncbi:winged helix-turn-helix domain-containing protein [Colwelliaceae bacterium BS250]
MRSEDHKASNANVQNNTSDNTNINVAQELHKGFAIGNIIIEPDLGVIIRDNERYHLAPKAMEVLIFLASSNCEVVSREQILDFGWGDSKASKTNITHIISEIRHALDDHKECPTFIQTIPRKGYRMILPTLGKPSNSLFSFTEQNSTINNSQVTRWSLSIALLKSSRLFKASATYVFISWILLQVFSIVLPIFNAPNWVTKFITLLLIIGLPVMLGLHWLRDIKNKRLLTQNKSNNKKFIYQQLAVDSTFVLAVLGVIYYLSTHLLIFIEDEAASAAQITQVQIPVAITVKNAVAVLSFTSNTEQPIPNYVISGVQEELISLLGRKPEFQVSSLRATNSLADNSSIADIKNRLGVKYIVEGSVKIEQQQLIINTVLIDSQSGFQVWSVVTTGDLKQLLNIYAELSRKVVNALHLLVPGDKLSNNSNDLPTSNFEAYDAYLQGKENYRQTKSINSLMSAKKLFKQALALDPKFILASSALCSTFLELYILTDDPLEYKNGLDVCELTASYQEASVESYLSLGKLYDINGRYSKAKQNLEMALNLNNNNPEVLIVLAGVYSKLKDTELATQLYLQAIDIEPTYWYNYYQYGIFLYYSGQYEKAIPQFNKVNLLNDKVALAYNALGGIYFLLMDIENANIAWSKALAIEPSALTYSNLATSLYFLHQYEDAVTIYQQSLELTPDDNTLWGNLADALKYTKNQQSKATSAYEKALLLAKNKEHINPNDVDLQSEITRYYSELKQCVSASSYNKNILSKEIKDPYIYYSLSISFFNCKQRTQAENMISKAIELGYSIELLLADPQFLYYKEELTLLQNSENNSS